MVEILGDNLKKFFDIVDNKCSDADITYAGNEYEVWRVSDELFQKMCDMSEEEFVELAGEYAWWRSSDGSNLPGWEIGNVIVNNETMQGWTLKSWADYCKTGGDEGQGDLHYKSLTEYLCNFVGASQPRNVCACAMDLAKYNNMTMGELFSKYEG